MSRLKAFIRRLASKAVHSGWQAAQRHGAITAAYPGPHAFRHIGHGTKLAFPQGTVFGAPWMELGEHCIIGQDVTLTVGMMPDLDLGPDPILRIGNGVVLGRGSHVIADTNITIGDDVYAGPYVYVTSANHSYDDPHQPIGKQWPRTAPVYIGSGSWLGAGALILPGAQLGRNVVVAAGSVVRGKVPDYSVVAGAPAKVVRQWSQEEGWQPPLRTPAPNPVPTGLTAAQLIALDGWSPDNPGMAS
ncbi:MULTISPECIES: acyltransferase [unclassified Streptomyces]|uniref:acyltransferase n=1 Tax=unclassified Streptomyces TaxID=2593676 RepID=UPI002E196514|nr:MULTISPECIES: acyltransferase [unclassified Streptomyces]